MAYYMRNNKGAKRGDIFYIANSKYYSTDPENEAGRPGVVVSCDELNENAECVEVVYLTTKQKRPMPTHTQVICKVPSTALCETIYTVSKDRLGDFVRTCTDEEMANIERAMQFSLGISAAAPVHEEVSSTDSSAVEVERNLYKNLYEQLLNKVVAF